MKIPNPKVFCSLDPKFESGAFLDPFQGDRRHFLRVGSTYDGPSEWPLTGSVVFFFFFHMLFVFLASFVLSLLHPNLNKFSEFITQFVYFCGEGVHERVSWAVWGSLLATRAFFTTASCAQTCGNLCGTSSRRR